MNLAHTEALLAAGYRRQAICYEKALDAARKLEEGMRQGGGTGTFVQELQEPLHEVAAIETEFQEHKQLWRRSGRRPGPALASALDKVAALIQELRVCVEASEQRARAHIDGLAPQLDQLARGRQMRVAYGKIMTTRHG